jgi:ketosteroid isomerase-like protein
MEHTTTEETLLKQVKEELDCWSGGDTEGYGKNAAEDITYFHNVPAGGRFDGREAFMGLLSDLKGQIPPHKYKAEEPKVQLYGNVALCTLVYHAMSSAGEVIASGRGTIVYRKVDAHWEMVHAHWSIME